MIKNYMKLAIKLAKDAKSKNEIPVGCVIIAELKTQNRLRRQQAIVSNTTRGHGSIETTSKSILHRGLASVPQQTGTQTTYRLRA